MMRPKFRTERRAGEMLAGGEKNVGGRPTENRSYDVTGSPRLSDIGITRNQSSRWQFIASLYSPISRSSARLRSTRGYLYRPVARGALMSPVSETPPEPARTCIQSKEPRSAARLLLLAQSNISEGCARALGVQ
jgi:hypothetical protein